MPSGDTWPFVFPPTAREWKELHTRLMGWRRAAEILPIDFALRLEKPFTGDPSHAFVQEQENAELETRNTTVQPFVMALDSDHDIARPTGAASAKPFYRLYKDGTQYPRLRKATLVGDARSTARASVETLDDDTLESLSLCTNVVGDFLVMADSFDIYAYHETPLWRLAEDLAALTRWTHRALSVIRDHRLGRAATSAFPTLPPAPATAPKTPTAARLLSPPATTPATSPAPETRPTSTTAAAVLKPTTSTTAPPPTPPPTLSPVPTVTPQPTAHSTPPSRLIVRYPDYKTLINRPRPQPTTVVESLNRALRTDFVSAISYSRQGQLVLHIKTPHSADQLLSKGNIIHSTLQKLFGLNATPRPKLETGDAWTKFVVHGVPIPSPKVASSGPDIPAFLSELCSTNGIDPAVVNNIRPLCPRDDIARRFSSPAADSADSISMLLCLADDTLADRLLRYGVVWFSAQCRVVRYRPRKGSSDTAASR
ncbi:hypothetical protein EXIGLDRAFT_828401 [Exidia glandulosa HHB12029]|uniref:Uncharacterized protein n=1 Tax=Exidia glandulosa HHB12029 TaxID=1314781 RepID=A0A165QF35_EXIGL|nr:hypothetical protein EXIGLDRAFT_828401 [Exidia glandulosa HHB12029]